MANVTYLIGAGASAGKRVENCRIIEGLPCVNEIPTQLLILISIIKNKNVPPEYAHLKEHLLEKLTSFHEMSMRHATIDTYAKKLKLRREYNEFYQTEAILTYFLIVQQLIHKPDSRYDTFFANILDNQLNIPNNINIISWNYDSQFEIAYQEYGIDKQLPIMSKATGTEIANPKIFKVNGTATFEGLSDIVSLRTEMPPLEAETRLSVKGVLFLLDLYKKVYENTEKRNTRLSFAFDDSIDDTMFRKINDIIYRTEALVIIGYTFPFFNREIDRKILHFLQPRAKVYIQDKTPERIRQNFMAVKGSMHNIQIELKEDTEQFFLPPEL